MAYPGREIRPGNGLKMRLMAKSFLNMAGYPRGLRNNNPGNLVDNGDNWQGLIGTDSAGFMIFQDCSFGIRALAIDLYGDIRDGQNNVRRLITEFAPPGANDTEAYISAVCNYTGYSPTQTLSNDPATLAKLIRAILNVELGSQYSNLLSAADIQEGINKMTAPVSTPVLVGSAVIAAGLLAAAIYALATMEPMPRRAGIRTR